jgi:uncharacterized membrane protein YoaK (UPF0700 family)
MERDNHTTEPQPSTGLGLAILLAWLAGWVDAAGFLRLNGIFLSFMSGNTTQLGVAIAKGHGSTVLLITSVVGLFVLGVFGGEWAAAIGSRPLVLGAECGLLWIGAVANWFEPSSSLILVPLVLAMGIQNASVRRASGIAISLTYVTGTLVHLGRELFEASRGAIRWRSTLPYAAMWAGFLAGAVTGAFAWQHGRVAALAAPAAIVSLLAVGAAAKSRDAGGEQRGRGGIGRAARPAAPGRGAEDDSESSRSRLRHAWGGLRRHQ